MRWINLIRAIVIFLSCFALAACVTSKQPLSKYFGGNPDYQLLGLWYNTDDFYNHEYLHIVIDLNKHMHLIRVSHPVSNRGGQVSVDEFFMYSTKLGTRQYMNIQLQSHPGKPSVREKQYVIAKYATYKDETLKVWTIRDDALIKAFKYHYLQGRHWQHNGRTFVKLESPQAVLRRWILNATDKEFNPPRVYKRIKKAPYREY